MSPSEGMRKTKRFSDDQDREIFLSSLGDVVTRYNWLCHAYCLMDHHYHLGVETPDGNPPIGMRQLNGVYTQRYNRRHKKTGHLFEGRFKAIWVEKGNDLLELCRYVVLNPVRAGVVVEKPEVWRWRSYQATAGIRKRPDSLTTEWIWGLFSGRGATARREYRKFVREGIGQKSPWGKVQGQAVLGEEGFVERIKGLKTSSGSDLQRPTGKGGEKYCYPDSSPELRIYSERLPIISGFIIPP